MKNFTAICGILCAMAGAAHAGGIDRSGQPISIIFEKGNYAELSYGWINPSVSGNDDAMFGGRGTGSVAGDHNLPGLALKYDFTDKLSGAIIYDQAYGADILYPIGQSIAFGGTSAQMDSEGLTGLLREKCRERGIKLCVMDYELMDTRVVSRQGMRDQINQFMVDVMKAEPLDPSVLVFDDSKDW